MFRRSWQRWAVAILIFLASAVYQRMTGPTYPVRGNASIAGEVIRYRLARSSEGAGHHRVALEVANPAITGTISFRRFNTNGPWDEVPMQREGTALVGHLPHQAPTEKLEYQIRLRSGDQMAMIPPDAPVVIRFKSEVPAFLLYAHIFLMSLAMIFSNRAGLEALSRHGRPRSYVRWTVITLFLGGIILGALVLKYAFGVWWTGFPVGSDITDNKTLIALVFWLAALVAGRKARRARGWVIVAALVMLAVYLIPHSISSSQL